MNMRVGSKTQKNIISGRHMAPLNADNRSSYKIIFTENGK